MQKILLSMGIFFTAFLMGNSVEAQILLPRPSPEASIKQDVGLSSVEVSYFRPSMKDRAIFGELVPYGTMWRTGANRSTSLTFGEDMMVDGKEVPAGAYALYSIPGKASWTLILYKKSDCWGVCEDYKESEEQLRWTVKPQKYPMTAETMTVNFANVGFDSADFQLIWENTMVGFNIKTTTKDQVQKSIDKAMAGTSPDDYYKAAVYYLEQDKDLDQALIWMDKALEKKEKFWMVRRKALILEKLNKYPEAIKTAERSIELAKEAENEDYVRMNEKSIEEWKTK